MAKRPPTSVVVSAQELAYALTELGDCMAAMNKKVYPVAKDRVVSAARRLRFMLEVEGKDEREAKSASG